MCAANARLAHLQYKVTTGAPIVRRSHKRLKAEIGFERPAGTDNFNVHPTCRSNSFAAYQMDERFRESCEQHLEEGESFKRLRNMGLVIEKSTKELILPMDYGTSKR